MEFSPEALADFVRGRFAALADPAKAAPMAKYMKTAMPFYGITKPGRLPVYREIRRRFRPPDQGAYERGVLSLWRLEHREEKYAAIEYATVHKAFVRAASLPLYERLIREGAWWDFVDPVASHLVGGALAADREAVFAELDRWIADPDLWVRRAALLAQLGHKRATDAARLFRYCAEQAKDTEFFIRKAIGWALRQYSYTDPDAVRRFVEAHRHELSPLSLREATRHLNRLGHEDANRSAS